MVAMFKRQLSKYLYRFIYFILYSVMLYVLKRFSYFFFCIVLFYITSLFPFFSCCVRVLVYVYINDFIKRHKMKIVSSFMCIVSHVDVYILYSITVLNITVYSRYFSLFLPFFLFSYHHSRQTIECVLLISLVIHTEN